MKSFTIPRKRTVVQICTDTYKAETDEQAIALANTDQSNKKDDGFSWHTLDEAIEYTPVTETDIIDVEEAKVKKTVYVVGFDPISGESSVGGFDWFYDKQNALQKMNEQMKDDTHFVWFRAHEVEVTGDFSVDGRNITTEIQNNIITWGAYGDWNFGGF